MSINRNNVRLVVLVTGDLILGEVINTTVSKFLQETAAKALDESPDVDLNGDITLNFPVAIVQKPDPSNPTKVGLSFVPWLPLKNQDKPVIIKSAVILAITEADSDLVKNFAQLHSDIALPDSRIALR